MSESVFNLEWVIEEAWVKTLKTYQAVGFLPQGLGIRHWTDVTSLPPGMYVMVHATNKGLVVGNWARPNTMDPMAVELGVFSATVPDSDGKVADRVRGVIAYQLPANPGFQATLVSNFPAGLSLGGLKFIGTHDYSEDPHWKIRYCTYHLWGEIIGSANPVPKTTFARQFDLF